MQNDHRYAAGESAVRKALRTNGKDARLWGLLGPVLMLQGRFEEAKQALEVAQFLDPGPSMSFLLMAQIDMYLKRVDAIRNPPTKMDLSAKAIEIFTDGVVSFGSADLQSESFYRQAIEGNPEDSGLYTALGLVLFREGRHEEARNVLRRATEIDLDSFDAWLSLALVLAENGDYAEARDSFNRVGKIEGVDNFHRNAASIQMYSLLRMEEDSKIMSQVFAEQFGNRPESQQPWTTIGHALLQKGLVSEGVQAFKRAVEFDSENPEPLLSLGEALTLLRRYDEAEKVCLRALELSPSNLRALAELGFVQLRLNRPEEALKSLDKANSISPNDCWILYNTACALVKTGRIEQAWQFLTESIMLNEDLKMKLATDRTSSYYMMMPSSKRCSDWKGRRNNSS